MTQPPEGVSPEGIIAQNSTLNTAASRMARREPIRSSLLPVVFGARVTRMHLPPE